MSAKKDVQRFNISKQFKVTVLNKVFPLKSVQTALKQTQKESKRIRELPAHIMVYYVIASTFFSTLNLKEVLRCFLEGFRFLHSCSNIKIAGKSGISQARKRLGYELLKQLYRNTVKPIACSTTKGAWYKGLRLVSLDGSTLNIPDEKINKDYFGHTNTYVENGYIYPQLRFVCLAETDTHVLFASQLGTYRESEVSLSREVIKNLQPGMLCLADRGFCYHSLWCQAVSTGAELLWRGRHHVIFPVEDILPDGSY